MKFASDLLYRDLASDPEREDMINLKALRDMLIGTHRNTGIVFAWGINDERTGGKSDDHLHEQ